MAEPIETVFMDECAAVAEALIEQVSDMEPRAIGTRRDHLLARSAYSVGLEIGLTIAVVDGAAGRRMRDWLARHVQQSEPAAIEARDRQAKNYLRVLG